MRIREVVFPECQEVEYVEYVVYSSPRKTHGTLDLWHSKYTQGKLNNVVVFMTSMCMPALISLNFLRYLYVLFLQLQSIS